MKSILSKSFLLITVTVIVVSCNTKTKSTDSKDHSADTTNKKSRNDADNRKITDSIPINNLPFGPSVFETYKFPGEWTDTYQHGKHSSRPDLELVKIDTFFNKLNRSNSFVEKLSEFHIEYIHYNGDSIMTHDEKLVDSGYICRLPNFGPYQCYYRFNKIDHGWFNGEDAINYDQYGDLIFIDPNTKSAKILNVFCYGQEGDLETVYRYFYIGIDKTIKVFKREGYGHWTMNRVEIKVLNNGQISIDKLK